MNGCKFIKFTLRGAKLSYLDHLTKLLIADEGFIDFEDGLLEHKINRIFQYLFRV